MASGTSKANQRQHKAHEKFYKSYQNDQRFEKNQMKKLEKHLKNYPEDRTAVAAFNALPATVRKSTTKSVAESPVQKRAKMGVTLTQVKKGIDNERQAA